MASSILLLDSNRNVRGGQTVFLQLATVATTLYEQLSLLFPLGGDLEFKARLRLGSHIPLHHLPELVLTRRRKGAWDLLKLALFTLGMVRHFPLIARHQVIYVNSGRLFVPLLFASFFFPGKRFLYHIHHDHNTLEKHLIRFIAQRPNTFRVVINSPFAYTRLCQAQPSLANHPRITVVENALAEEFSDLPFEDRFTDPVSTPLRVAVIGGIGPEKGQDWVVDLAPRLPDVTFYVIGGVEPGCDAFATDLRAHAPANVQWLGESTDLIASIRQHQPHLSLMPSRCLEAFGLVAIESMACSCLTLTSGMGGLDQIATQTGALRFTDLESLHTLLTQLTTTPPEQLREIARQQHQQTGQHYHQEIFRRKIGGILAAAAF